ncbi:MAG: hypothetical protein KJI71_04925 [Patescibacteria group bacterium]|nr:hypothetical protein [Patescibacteria group bacterium]
MSLTLEKKEALKKAFSSILNNLEKVEDIKALQTIFEKLCPNDHEMKSLRSWTISALMKNYQLNPIVWVRLMEFGKNTLSFSEKTVEMVSKYVLTATKKPSRSFIAVPLE